MAQQGRCGDRCPIRARYRTSGGWRATERHCGVNVYINPTTRLLTFFQETETPPSAAAGVLLRVEEIARARFLHTELLLPRVTTQLFLALLKGGHRGTRTPLIDRVLTGPSNFLSYLQERLTSCGRRRDRRLLLRLVKGGG